MPVRVQKVLVVLPNGLEYSSKLMTGINYFRDEQPEFEPYQFHFSNNRKDPLPADLSPFQGAVTWMDQGCDWMRRLLSAKIRVVNCCFDWQGTPGVVSLGLSQEKSCDIVLAHIGSLKPHQFAVIGVDFAVRPHAKMLCQKMVDRAKSAGLDAVLYELSGPHPDELRSRITEMESEQLLLEFLTGLKRPAAIWCENDFIARMVCNAADHLGVTVPNQFSVVGCGDYRVATYETPSITTLPRPAEEIGFAAAQLLSHWIANNDSQPSDMEFSPGPLLLRQSSVAAVNWDRVRMGHELIKTEACNGLTVDRICRTIGLSKMTFTKRYTELYGTTPGVDISLKKVEQAVELLRDSSLSIAQIGITIGFKEQAKFTKFFKRHTGKTPSEYRQSLKN